jgi:hypothetical protein
MSGQSPAIISSAQLGDKEQQIILEGQKRDPDGRRLNGINGLRFSNDAELN